MKENDDMMKHGWSTRRWHSYVSLYESLTSLLLLLVSLVMMSEAHTVKRMSAICPVMSTPLYKMAECLYILRSLEK